MGSLRSASESYMRLLLLELAAALRAGEYETAAITAMVLASALTLYNAGEHTVLDKMARGAMADA